MKKTLIVIMALLSLSSCFAENAGEVIYGNLGNLLEEHQISFENVKISDSNDFSRDMIQLIVYYPEYHEVCLSIPNNISLISISPREWESANKGDFQWRVAGNEDNFYVFTRDFEKIPYDAYAVGLSERIDNPLSPEMKGVAGIAKALRELGKSQKEATKLIVDAKAELNELSSEELFLESCKAYPELLKKEKDIKKATKLALLILVRDSSGGHAEAIYYFRLNNNTIYMNLYDSPISYSSHISVYDVNGNLLWIGDISVKKNSKYAKNKGMSLLYQILR